MKFSSARSANLRERMRERHRRDRAAAQLLRDRYPQFASIRLDFDFSDDGPFTPAPQVTVLHPPARTFFFLPCPYADCDGEFDLTEAVSNLARDKQTHAEGQLKCSGTRLRDKDARSPCGLTLEYLIIAEMA